MVFNAYAEPLALLSADHTQAQKNSNVENNNTVSKQIALILKQHFSDSSNIPPHIEAYLDEMALYYSRYPQAVKLLLSLQGKNWQLVYEPRTFRTDVEGSRLHIRSIKVLFDPLSAAKMKFHNACQDKVAFCVASPADTLLHEFLHVYDIVYNTNSFLAEGGMNGVLYPFKHERRTISKERLLYKAMTRADQLPRPLRNEHTGKHKKVTCSVCIN